MMTINRPTIFNMPKPGSTKSSGANEPFWSIRGEDTDEPELLLYGVLDESEFWGDEVTSQQFARDMMALRGKNVKVRINSPGGNVFTGLAMHSIIKQHDKTVTVYIDGLAASAASVVAMAGDEVVMPAGSMMMIHNPWTIAVGESKDFRKLADDLDKIRDSLMTAYEEKTGMSREDLTTLMDEETWLSAAQAKEYGFADTVESELQVAASIGDGRMTVNGVSFSMDRFKTLPAALVAAANKQSNQPEPAGIQTASRTEDVMDLEKIKAQHPDLYKQIMDAGRDEGVKQERQRINDIEDMAMPGHDDLVNKAKFETGESAAELAVNIVKAEKNRGENFLTQRSSDAKAVAAVGQNEVDPAESEKTSADEEKRSTWRDAAKKVGKGRKQS